MTTAKVAVTQKPATNCNTSVDLMKLQLVIAQPNEEDVRVTNNSICMLPSALFVLDMCSLQEKETCGSYNVTSEGAMAFDTMDSILETMASLGR